MLQQCASHCSITIDQGLLGAGLDSSDTGSSHGEIDHQAEGLWVAAGLRRDFEAAGINLPDDQHAAADKLTASIERLRMLIGTGSRLYIAAHNSS